MIERVREGVTILLNDVWHSVVIDFRCVSSRIFLIKFKYQGLKYVWWWQRGNFWSNLDSVGNGYRLCLLGELNGLFLY